MERKMQIVKALCWILYFVYKLNEKAVQQIASISF